MRTCRTALRRSKRCCWFCRERIVSFINDDIFYSSQIYLIILVTTIQELVNTIKLAVNTLKESGKPITSVCSACELFICFITLASPKLEDKTMDEVKTIMLNRGNVFLKKLEESRHVIAKHAMPFITDGCVSYSATFGVKIVFLTLPCFFSEFWFIRALESSWRLSSWPRNKTNTSMFSSR